MGVPLTGNFIGEFLSLLGSYQQSIFITTLGATSIILSAVYSIFTYNRIASGAVSPYIFTIPDMYRKEFYIILPLLVLTLVLGIFPSFIISDIEFALSHSLLFSLAPVIFNGNGRNSGNPHNTPVIQNVVPGPVTSRNRNAHSINETPTSAGSEQSNLIESQSHNEESNLVGNPNSEEGNTIFVPLDDIKNQPVEVVDLHAKIEAEIDARRINGEDSDAGENHGGVILEMIRSNLEYSNQESYPKISVNTSNISRENTPQNTPNNTPVISADNFPVNSPYPGATPHNSPENSPVSSPYPGSTPENTPENSPENSPYPGSTPQNTPENTPINSPGNSDDEDEDNQEIQKEKEEITQEESQTETEREIQRETQREYQREFLVRSEEEAYDDSDLSDDTDSTTSVNYLERHLGRRNREENEEEFTENNNNSNNNCSNNNIISKDDYIDKVPEGNFLFNTNYLLDIIYIINNMNNYFSNITIMEILLLIITFISYYRLYLICVYLKQSLIQCYFLLKFRIKEIFSY